MEKAPKYPKMRHLPWSKAAARGNKYFDSVEDAMFYGNDNVVVTEKIDGSNVCLTGENLFARSHGHEPRHKSFDMLKKMYHEGIRHRIPEQLAVYGEWLYAKHSIEYSSLPSYLLIFDVLDMEKERWGSWKDVVRVSRELGLETVPLLYRGEWTDVLRHTNPEGKSEYGDEREGLVFRYGLSFPLKEFDLAVGKVVRRGHIQTDEHWKKGEIERNEKVQAKEEGVA
ncbi:hypothetical protein AKJ40_00815 [candidate division MSBL1 archaeon SCGC-AAA259M10]|uniref:RNA ligase domain-containing protein n=2 Tax=candidate division MSBL1 TaxID=215777 RepID=A0A133U889_9EURY|nr:hypothetical protein AKJ61_00900 [candidate division MSBL1 archaeon SCGC-AAA259B11]KXB00734.1 hypothetical protein AKJ40_00815 [candidate division MSBL1 archaeon SCGC-AAA259M10]